HLLEEACLFFVAVTRARDELALSHAERYGRMRYKPSPFLRPIQERLGARLARLTWSGEESAAATALAAYADETAPPVRSGAPVEWMQGAPLRPAAIETYTRCPQQYAYRYVYGLRPREVGMVTLRRALHETLRTLEGRFAVHAEAESMHGGETAGVEG